MLALKHQIRNSVPAHLRASRAAARLRRAGRDHDGCRPSQYIADLHILHPTTQPHASAGPPADSTAPEATKTLLVLAPGALIPPADYTNLAEALQVNCSTTRL